MTTIFALTFLNGLILLANIGILALSLKLYTEYFKDVSQKNRNKS